MSLHQVRNARRARGKSLSIEHVSDQPTKSYGGTKVNGTEVKAPLKHRPFATYPDTPIAKAAEEVDHGVEGKVSLTRHHHMAGSKPKKG